MRLLVMVRPNEDEVARYEAGGMPAADDLAKMEAFNQTLINDVVILDMGGLRPTSKSVRIDYSGARPQITDGPFAETKELIAGFCCSKRARRKSSSNDSRIARSSAASRSKSAHCFRTKIFEGIV
jgi:hypothetical protein